MLQGLPLRELLEGFVELRGSHYSKVKRESCVAERVARAFYPPVTVILIVVELRRLYFVEVGREQKLR